MSSSSKRTVSFTFPTSGEKEYYNEVAKAKGYGNISVMSRVALHQMMTRQKVPEYVEPVVTNGDGIVGEYIEGVQSVGKLDRGENR